MAEIGCILCIHLGLGRTPAELHHIRRFGGRRDNAEIIPLCPYHHRGQEGVHHLGHKGFAKHHQIDEFELLALTQKQLNADS